MFSSCNEGRFLEWVMSDINSNQAEFSNISFGFAFGTDKYEEYNIICYDQIICNMLHPGSNKDLLE